jgi:XapX domain-containing protein
MRSYLIALGAGILVGIVYGLLHVRSPAPPVVALVGLLGMLVGEQVIPMTERLLARESNHISWLKSEALPHLFGPMRRSSAALAKEGEEES